MLKIVCLQKWILKIVFYLDLLNGYLIKCIGYKKRHTPPGPRGLPLVGNLFQIGDNPQEVFTSWNRKYGDVYSIKLGRWPCVVLNGHKVIYEALVKRKDDFSDRPPFSSFKEYAGGNSISFHKFNQNYLYHRKIASKSLTGFLLNGGLECIIDREVDNLISQLDKLCNQVSFDPRYHITKCIGGILYSVCFGAEKELKNDSKYMDLILGNNPTTELFTVGKYPDAFPILQYFSKFSLRRGHSKRTNNYVKANNEKVKEHLKYDETDNISIMNLLMTLFKSSYGWKKCQPSANQIMSTTIEFISAGVDTSTSTLLWLVLYMAKYPDVQDRVYKELQHLEQVPIHSLYRKRDHVPYTESCIWEVMRLNTTVPFSLPHFTRKHSHVSGYHIPQNTLVLTNLVSVCRDPTLWENPDDFQPERFLKLDQHGFTAVNRHLVQKFMPFSCGRRRCIGEQLGKKQVFTVFTKLLLNFKISTHASTGFSAEFGDVQKPKQFEIFVEKR